MNNFYPGTTNFEEKAPEYSALVEQWGNKSILEYKINAALKQAEWLEKRDGFNASSGELIKGYTHSAAAINRDFAAIPSWTQTQIAKRNRWIADCFLKIWGFEPSENIEHFSHFREP
jgi:hypothetical protein